MDLFARFQKLAGPEEQKRFLSPMGNHPNGHSDALAREMFKVGYAAAMAKKMVAIRVVRWASLAKDLASSVKIMRHRREPDPKSWRRLRRRLHRRRQPKRQPRRRQKRAPVGRLRKR